MNNNTPLQKLTLEQRTVYGRELIYPICDLSKTLVKLTQRITFSLEDVEVLKQAGFEINIDHI